MPRSSTGLPWSVASDKANAGRFDVEVLVDHAEAAQAKFEKSYRAKFGEHAEFAGYKFVVKPPITE